MLVKFKLYSYYPHTSSPEIAVNPWAVDYVRKNVGDATICHIVSGAGNWCVQGSYEEVVHIINVATQGAARK